MVAGSHASDDGLPRLPSPAPTAQYQPTGGEMMKAGPWNVVRSRRGFFAVAAMCMLAAPQLASAQGNYDQYDVTVKMEMVGMPMAMPPMMQRLCVKKGARDEDFVPRQENCRVSDSTRTGSRLTFKIACTGNNPMTGTGDFTFGASGYNGQMRLKGKMEGQDVDMTQTIAANRVGGCTAR
jgi:hypothetical protein